MTQQETYQIGLMLAVATLIGASTGYLASIRGRFKMWAILVAPIAACAANIGVLFLVGFLTQNPSGGQATWTWTQVLGGLIFLSLGVGLWGAIPAILASLVFQSHCRFSKRL